MNELERAWPCLPALASTLPPASTDQAEESRAGLAHARAPRPGRPGAPGVLSSLPQGPVWGLPDLPAHCHGLPS